MKNFLKVIAWLAVLLLVAVQAQAQSLRDRWQEPERVLDSLQVHPGMVVGELGAGSGYFTLKLARRVGPTGKVLANDIDALALGRLRRDADKAGLGNIETIVGRETDPRFPPASLGLLVMVYVFHDLSKPVPLMRALEAALKPGAAVAIIDRDPERFPGDEDHFMRREKLVGLLKEAGYRVVKTWTFLARDNIYLALPDSGADPTVEAL